jgi:hypothetical protein
MKLTRYNEIKLPVKGKFSESPKTELRDYYRWFHEVTPLRVAELAGTVQSSPGSAGWLPNHTPKSLNSLGDWFATQVQTRQRTPDERQEISSWVGAPEWELTNRTFSVAIDTGMYLGTTLTRNHPSLRWDQPFGSKKYINYGQPVLVGFAGDVEMNPVQIVTTLAYALASNNMSKNLRMLYDIWSKMVNQ